MASADKSPQDKISILAVDDEAGTLKLYTSILKGDNYHLETASTGGEAIEKMRNEHFDLVLLDLRLPDIDGMQVLKEIQEKTDAVSVIIVTANPSLDSSIEAVRAGVYDYIVKPFGSEDLKMVVSRAVEKVKLVIQNRRLSRKLEKTNKALVERVEELEKCAKIATSYEGQLEELTRRIKELEKKKKV